MGKKEENFGIELSEGQAIAVTVLLIAAGLIASVFAIQFIIGHFFPNLF